MDTTWRIVTTKWDDITGGIIEAHWDVVATEGSDSERAYGSVGFTPNPGAEDFVSLQQVTEPDVLGWVRAALDGSDTTSDAIEASVVAVLTKRLGSTVEEGLPWN